MLIEAKKEFLYTISGKARVKCAMIIKGADYLDDDDRVFVNLKVGYTDSDWDLFLSQLEFEYDAGFGGQELFGTIWLEDGTWFSRGEYDGSEWWEYNKLPDIPSVLFN